ncbi:MAG: hypothetical protein EHM79_21450 [Geobacter sp.]|nr:MAG: hypothetical protein EHM79_21450 [Geobacter sp.]
MIPDHIGRQPGSRLAPRDVAKHDPGCYEARKYSSSGSTNQRRTRPGMPRVGYLAKTASPIFFVHESIGRKLS